MTDEQIVEGLEVYREYYHDVGMFENNLYDGVPELIKDLHADGVTLSTATSKPEFSASRIIEHFGLREYFTFIGAADLAGTRDDKSAVIAHTLESLQASSQ
ncbi:MAG: HAD hydrolase-like protein, partial [Actinomycetota bacterium]